MPILELVLSPFQRLIWLVHEPMESWRLRLLFRILGLRILWISFVLALLLNNSISPKIFGEMRWIPNEIQIELIPTKGRLDHENLSNPRD